MSYRGGSKPREYPQEIVDLACEMYQSGMTVKEICAAFPKGYRVQTILERYLPDRRPAAKRDQWGPRHHAWRGDAASYGSLHERVENRRGKPSHCSWCGATEGRFEWANLSGNYADVSDYERLCASCHRTYDAARRRETGIPTSPLGGAA